MGVPNKTEAAEEVFKRVNVTKINRTAAIGILKQYSSMLETGVKNTIELELEVDQSFKVTNADSVVFYVVSANHFSQKEPESTCTILLVNNEKSVVSAVNTVGPNEELRPWMCDGAEAISFLDYYADGSLKVIALYHATAPSSAQFTVPVVFKLDLNKPSLEIDERLTRRFDGKDVETIATARAVLNRR